MCPTSFVLVCADPKTPTSLNQNRILDREPTALNVNTHTPV